MTQWEIESNGEGALRSGETVKQKYVNKKLPVKTILTQKYIFFKFYMRFDTAPVAVQITVKQWNFTNLKYISSWFQKCKIYGYG